MTSGAEPPRRSITFADRRWWVKRATDPVGPGQNRFDDSDEAVTVTADGRLSLRIRRSGDRWFCAEVVGEAPTSYGTYEWTVASDVAALDRQVVCGMFTWSEEPAHFHRELDIELSAWGQPDGVHGKFVVQPYESKGHERVFAIPRRGGWRCSVAWQPRRVTFGAAGDRWTFTGGVPPAGLVHPRINLWLFGGAAPTGGEATTVEISDFRFTPAVG